jgi:eukaryotic-like serine/threonine-protein kinase
MVAETARATFADGMSSGAPVRTLADGDQLGGRYQIRRFIARGGMGEVYEAFDLSLGETVALKTLSPTMLDQGYATERLIAEVRLARKVTHPNVCRILEFGLHRRQGDSVEVIPFLTMEMLAGETLGSRIRRVGRLDLDQAASVLRGIAEGLRAVHQAGIVHRDFKTENVFLVHRDDDAERPVVMDFGLARALEVNRGARASSANAIIGTVAYMAPEQVEGQAPTPAFDVYALGIVAFEMITGRLPFGGDSPLAVATLRLRQEAPRPSSLRPGLPVAWDVVIGRCLARDPRRRFATVDQVVAALDQLSAEHARRWPARWPRATLAIAGVIALAVAISVATAARRSPVSPGARLPRPVSVARVEAASSHETPRALAPPLDSTHDTAARPVPAQEPTPRAHLSPNAHRPVAKRAHAVDDASPTAGPPASREAAEGVDDLIDPFPASSPKASAGRRSLPR